MAGLCTHASYLFLLMHLGHTSCVSLFSHITLDSLHVLSSFVSYHSSGSSISISKQNPLEMSLVQLVEGIRLSSRLGRRLYVPDAAPCGLRIWDFPFEGQNVQKGTSTGTSTLKMLAKLQFPSCSGTGRSVLSHRPKPHAAVGARDRGGTLHTPGSKRTAVSLSLHLTKTFSFFLEYFFKYLETHYRSGKDRQKSEEQTREGGQDHPPL